MDVLDFIYAMLLPVPDNEAIKPQVLDEKGKPWGNGADSHLSIELLFYKEDLLGRYFEKKTKPGGGKIIEFSGNKTKFAKEIVPTFKAQRFEVIRPVFEFIESKCTAA